MHAGVLLFAAEKMVTLFAAKHNVDKQTTSQFNNRLNELVLFKREYTHLVTWLTDTYCRHHRNIPTIIFQALNYQKKCKKWDIGAAAEYLWVID